MHVRVVTLFPDMVMAGLSVGISGRALERGLAEVRPVNPRDFASDAHRTVDDRPYGGGPGMVLKFEPFAQAIRVARQELPSGARVAFLTPQGRRLDQRLVREMRDWPGLVLVAGRYEGFDQRLIEAEGDVELSLGDFVLSGGELAAMAIIDAVIRLLPGALGDDASADMESFNGNLLDCPHFTRPEIVEGRAVPAVLTEGHHEAIRRWRLKQALGRTWARRPDLLAGRDMNAEEISLLREYQAEQRAVGGNGTGLWQ
jgi:tRNA (guanine37-N1)-methyltransferase